MLYHRLANALQVSLCILLLMDVGECKKPNWITFIYVTYHRHNDICSILFSTLCWATLDFGNNLWWDHLMRWFLVFVMPDSSTFKNVGGQANIVVVVYVSDPNGQLIPSQVAEYALHIGRISSLKLSWQRDDPTCCNMCHGRGAHRRTLIHLCLWNDVSSEDSDFVNVMFVESLPHAVYDWLHTLKCNRNMPCPSWMKHSNEIIMWLQR